MKRNENSETLKEVMYRLIKAYGLGPKLLEVEVKQSWDDIMGPVIATKTSHIKLIDGILKVKVTSAALKNELSMAKSKIAKMMNESLKSDTIKEVQIF